MHIYRSVTQNQRCNLTYTTKLCRLRPNAYIALASWLVKPSCKVYITAYY